MSSVKALPAGAKPLAKPTSTAFAVRPEETGSRWDSILRADNALAVSMVVVLGVMILPLPPMLLDFLLALSVGLGLVVFLFALHIERPLEFSAFPSLLLLLTLFRLALNLASTRLILLRGGEGEEAAGAVIKAFGQFVVGGNTVVGIIVFLILVLINFIVITKGAGRIAEVAARFTLDAMPGKQMAIDSDLSAGLITEIEAKERRTRVESEADFFGSMDGSSKFVRGDAIAGLVITAVNIVGGLIVGVAQNDMGFAEAGTTYTSLTVGDGLVSQIPALLTSIAAGLVTTRASAGGPLGDTVKLQLFGAQRPLTIASGVLICLALVPGMPHLSFLVLGGTFGFMAWRLNKNEDDAPDEAKPKGKSTSEREELESLLPLDLLEIEVGYELVPLVDQNRDGSLLRRISGIRKQVAQELGVLVPPIHLRDNLRLRPGGYRIMLSGNEIGLGELRVGKLMVMNPAGDVDDIVGEDTTEPAFGIAAKWTGEAHRERAEMLGYTVVDSATVLATHLGELLNQHADLLVGRRETQELLDLHGKENGKVIEELIPNELGMGTLIKVLRNLLRERVSIRDFRGILEELADNIAKVKEPDELTELVRRRLGRQITARYAGQDGRLHALVLGPEVEGVFRRIQSPTTGVINPAEVKAVLNEFETVTSRLASYAEVPALVVAADIRRSVSTFASRHLTQVAVLSFRELDPNVELLTVGVVGQTPAQAGER